MTTKREKALAAIRRALEDDDYLEDTFMIPYMRAASKARGGRSVDVHHEGMRAALRALLDMHKDT